MRRPNSFQNYKDEPIDPLDDRDINNLETIKREMLPKSLMYSGIVIGIFEGGRLLANRILYLENPLTMDLPKPKVSQMKVRAMRYSRYLAITLGIATSFSYFSLKYSEERYLQCAKYHDLLNEYLDYKERKINNKAIQSLR